MALVVVVAEAEPVFAELESPLVDQLELSMNATVGTVPVVEVDIVAVTVAEFAVVVGVLVAELQKSMLVDWLGWRLFVVEIFEIVYS